MLHLKLPGVNGQINLYEAATDSHVAKIRDIGDIRMTGLLSLGFGVGLTALGFAVPLHGPIPVRSRLIRSMMNKEVKIVFEQLSLLLHRI